MLTTLLRQKASLDYLDDGVPVVHRRELLEEALRDKGREGHVLSVFLHLFLGVLRTLEGEVVKPDQHPAPGVHSADQLVGGAQRYSKCQVLGVLLGSETGNNSSRTLQPTHYLESTVSGQLSVCNNI